LPVSHHCERARRQQRPPPPTHPARAPCPNPPRAGPFRLLTDLHAGRFAFSVDWSSTTRDRQSHRQRSHQIGASAEDLGELHHSLQTGSGCETGWSKEEPCICPSTAPASEGPSSLCRGQDPENLRRGATARGPPVQAGGSWAPWPSLSPCVSVTGTGRAKSQNNTVYVEEGNLRKEAPGLGLGGTEKVPEA
jgi:hypothetical protein